jgi:hypothetical protein
MKYHEIFPLSRPELETLIETGNETAITDALLSAAYYNSDWRWVQDLCLRFMHHPNRVVRSAAVICLGHVARIHKTLDLDIVLPKLAELKAEDPSIAPWVDDAIGDIRFFLRVQ